MKKRCKKALCSVLGWVRLLLDYAAAHLIICLASFCWGRRIKLRVFCDLSLFWNELLRDRHGLPCVHENRVFFCGANCLVEKFVSFLLPVVPAFNTDQGKMCNTVKFTANYRQKRRLCNSDWALWLSL